MTPLGLLADLLFGIAWRIDDRYRALEAERQRKIREGREDLVRELERRERAAAEAAAHREG